MKGALVCIFLAGFLLGCQERPCYYIGVVNKTGRDLQNVSVLFSGKQEAHPGWLAKDGCATEGPVTTPIPPEAELRLDERVMKVNLEGVVPARFFDGTIYFIFGTNDSLQVKTARADDIEAKAAIMRGGTLKNRREQQ
jgi:hypothetical protein